VLQAKEELEAVMKAPFWSLAFAWLVLATTGAWADAPVKIVALGHSAFADKSGPSSTDYPEQLAAALKAKGYNVTMANAGVYGDTTDGVRRRLDKAVTQGTDIVLLWIGGNDARRGASFDAISREVSEIVGRLRAKGAEVLVFGPYASTLTVEKLPDRIRVRLPPLPPDMIALDHATTAGKAKWVEWTLPIAEELIATVRGKR
jgi:lysophospholipase L1-like esterase